MSHRLAFCCNVTHHDGTWDNQDWIFAVCGGSKCTWSCESDNRMMLARSCFSCAARLCQVSVPLNIISTSSPSRATDSLLNQAVPPSTVKRRRMYALYLRGFSIWKLKPVVLKPYCFLIYQLMKYQFIQAVTENKQHLNIKWIFSVGLIKFETACLLLFVGPQASFPCNSMNFVLEGKHRKYASSSTIVPSSSSTTETGFSGAIPKVSPPGGWNEKWVNDGTGSPLERNATLLRYIGYRMIAFMCGCSLYISTADTNLSLSLVSVNFHWFAIIFQAKCVSSRPENSMLGMKSTEQSEVLLRPSKPEHELRMDHPAFRNVTPHGIACANAGPFLNLAKWCASKTHGDTLQYLGQT